MCAAEAALGHVAAVSLRRDLYNVQEDVEDPQLASALEVNNDIARHLEVRTQRLRRILKVIIFV